MSLNKPFFSCEPTSDAAVFKLRHNCNGSLNFAATDDIDATTARLIVLAIEEGKRIRSREISQLLSGN